MHPGIAAAACAYFIWGLLPIYFKYAGSLAGALEIVLHRSVWSLAFLLVVLAVLRRLAWLPRAFRQPRLLALFGLSALLLSANWLLFVWAINAGHVVESSLGYFINPLVNVLLGRLVLHERLRRAQWLAVGIAAGGVLWLTVQAGQLPWIGLALAATFGFYGLIRKTAPLGALEGLTLETLLMAAVAAPLLAWLLAQGGSALGHAGAPQWLALMAAGPLTAIPLLLFAYGARRITLALLGLLQYIGPTIQFALGVWLYGEPFSPARLLGFGLIWAALALYTAEGWWAGRGRAAAAA